MLAFIPFALLLHSADSQTSTPTTASPTTADPTMSPLHGDRCGHEDSTIPDLEIQIWRQQVEEIITMEITGPADKWFGFGFGDDINRM